MELFKAIETRRSIRKFSDQKVPLYLIEKILGAGIKAPSGCNSQPWRFIFSSDSSKFTTLTPKRKYTFVENAPNMIIVCIDPHNTFARQDEEATDHILDTAAAIENMLLAINALGLGAVWVTGFSRLAVRKEFNIPKHWLINSLIPFGYYEPEDIESLNSKKSPRKPLSEVAFIENIETPFRVE